MRRRLSLALTFALATSSLVVVAPPAALAAVEVTVGEFFFEPATVSVKVGEPVIWRFAGKGPHTVTAADGSFDSGVRYSGTFSATPTEAGTIGYFCQLHPDMQGTINVASTQATTLQASDTVGAALAWSRQFWPDGAAGTVLLGRSDVFADSLASGGLQGALDAPLLLTPPNSLASAVRAELQRLGAARVVILGGTAAISSGVEQALRDAGYRVSRVAGASRYSTATAIANQFHAAATSALVARGTGDAADPTRAWVDSLGAGAVAARTGQPLLLSASEGLSRETQQYLEDSRIDHVTLIGGEEALSAKVQADIERLGITVDRAAGPDRFGTALAVSELVVFDPDLGSPASVLLVDGRHPSSWASGFAAASVAELTGGIVMLTDGETVPGPTFVPLVYDRAGVICGAFVDGTACSRANTASNVDTDFMLPSNGTVAGVLTPEQEVEDGPPGVTGVSIVSGTSDPRALCYEYFVPALAAPDAGVTAAHIHEGVEGESGPPVVTLETTTSFPFDFDVVNCAFGLDPALVTDILANPTDYYLNVHTEQFPKGATRGQLFTVDTTLLVDMSGDQEVEGGQPGAGGFGIFITSQQDPSLLGYFTLAFGVQGPITASHIHDAPIGQSGPPVITLQPPVEVDEGFAFVVGRQRVDDEALLADIEANPREYYVNVHTEQFPKGAVRGQLFDPFKEPNETATAASFRAFGTSR